MQSSDTSQPLNPRLEQPKISYIIPIFNEAENIKKFIEQLYDYTMTLQHQFEIIIIDDGSHDGCLAIIQDLMPHYRDTLKLISFSRNFGKEYAITAGLEHCQGDVAIIIDADFQQPFSQIPIFLEAWHEGYDMVYAVQDK